MPRGRSKLIGPLLPKGGYKSLTTKKRLAENAAAYAAAYAVKVMPPISIFNSASPAERELMLSGLTNKLNYKKPIKAKRKATEAQLAALAKGRAAKTQLKNAAQKMVTAANKIVASVNVDVVPKKTRTRLTPEQKALKAQQAADKKALQAQKKADKAQLMADKKALQAQKKAKREYEKANKAQIKAEIKAKYGKYTDARIADRVARAQKKKMD
jgi:hypothetical protein